MSADLILVGGGLANGLIALAVAAQASDRRMLMIDDGTGAVSGGHTWSFHDTDLGLRQHRWIASAVAHRWPRQEVRFPGFTRALRTGYASLTDASLGAALDRLPGLSRLHARAARIGADKVTLADGTILRGPCVIDGTGRIPAAHLVLGWQKFVGIEIETDAPHGRDVPIIMDATVSQHDGYRFVYTLPFSDRRILVEDTHYTDGPALAEGDLAAAIMAYAAAQGWRGTEIRRERGVLPIALAFDAAGFWRQAQGGAVPVGMRAGLFHPVTGYSLPLAAQVADRIAAAPPTTAAAFAAVRDFALDTARRQGFPRLLSRMLFRGVRPEGRRAVLERFYRLPEPLIERFYAGRLTAADRARILIGKPPIPIRAALPCLREAPLLAALPKEPAP